MGHVLPAGEEPQERPAALRDVAAEPNVCRGPRATLMSCEHGLIALTRFARWPRSIKARTRRFRLLAKRRLTSLRLPPMIRLHPVDRLPLEHSQVPMALNGATRVRHIRCLGLRKEEVNAF
jgi:hypothetical protein